MRLARGVPSHTSGSYLTLAHLSSLLSTFEFPSPAIPPTPALDLQFFPLWGQANLT